PQVGQLDRNLNLASAGIAAAVARGADVIVLPELVTSGYCFASCEEARSLAIRPDHPAFGSWAAVAGSAVVVAGFAELGQDGRLYNSAALLGGDGVRAVYRKTHLWDSELLFFTPGTAAPPVVETAVGRIAVMICYDMEFPEMTRSVALRGADLLAVPTNWPWVDRPESMPAPEVVIAMAAARVNRLPIACCDRRGTERGQRWNEASTIIGADGWQLSGADADGIVSADVDLAAGRDKAISTRNDVLRDRRPAIYRRPSPDRYSPDDAEESARR
ncbi:MAG: hydrolase, partial [Actinomycetota bacterium]|nr:hydrolase [Actinomycetota bacterium]